MILPSSLSLSFVTSCAKQEGEGIKIKKKKKNPPQALHFRVHYTSYYKNANLFFWFGLYNPVYTRPNKLSSDDELLQGYPT